MLCQFSCGATYEGYSARVLSVRHEEENEQRSRSSFSGFSGVVPTQITAPAREPRERLNDRLSVRLRASK